jgi:hypothetical protein
VDCQKLLYPKEFGVEALAEEEGGEYPAKALTLINIFLIAASKLS